jgi:hypothetical protein
MCEDKELEVAIQVMKDNIEKTQLKRATKEALMTLHGYDEEKAEKYASLAYLWWMDAFCN